MLALRRPVSGGATRLRSAVRFVANNEFIKSAAGLDSRSQARIWTTLDKFRRTPDARGLNVESLKGGSGLKSCRVSRAVRIIMAESDGLTVLLFVGQHEEAYKWAERHHAERTAGPPVPVVGSFVGAISRRLPASGAPLLFPGLKRILDRGKDPGDLDLEVIKRSVERRGELLQARIASDGRPAEARALEGESKSLAEQLANTEMMCPHCGECSTSHRILAKARAVACAQCARSFLPVESGRSAGR